VWTTRPEEAPPAARCRGEEDHPAGREDPLRTVTEIRRDAGSSYVADDGGRERPVEEEAGQREEQDDAECEVGHDAGERTELRLRWSELL
jgi:hypothetical protein